MLDPTTAADDGPLARPHPQQGWRERVEDLADATGTTPLRLLAGAGAVAALLGVGVWLLRPPDPPVEVALPFASTTEAASAASTTTEPPTSLLVHVAGAVAVPGVHEVPSEARVVDAIDAAGGLVAGADGSRINLAAPLSDGERIYVPVVGEVPPPVAVGSEGGSSPEGQGSGPVDLNSADAAALESLNGVGPATAAAILEHRARIGRFTSVDQLLDVRGIGEAKLEALRDQVRV
ncbi:MAG: helix-hairpin-helix domain-containing protein [Acidimicrobiales bacterium]